MNTTKLTAHPFAQLASADVEQVSGGYLKGEIKQVTLRIPEDGISDLRSEGGAFTTAVGEDGPGPVQTTMAVGEEGGDFPATF